MKSSFRSSDLLTIWEKNQSWPSLIDKYNLLYGMLNKELNRGFRTGLPLMYYNHSFNQTTTKLRMVQGKRNLRKLQTRIELGNIWEKFNQAFTGRGTISKMLSDVDRTRYNLRKVQSDQHQNQYLRMDTWSIFWDFNSKILYINFSIWIFHLFKGFSQKFSLTFFTFEDDNFPIFKLSN